MMNKENNVDMKLGIKNRTIMTKQEKMNELSNQIADLAVNGASKEELEKAIEHSIEVIDSYKK